MTKINNNKEGFNMEPTQDTIDYFNSVSRKIELYHSNIAVVKKYISRKRISNSGKISNLVIMAVVWTSLKLGEFLTETDVLVILGSHQSIGNTSIMSLDPELASMSLIELMDAVGKAYDEKYK